MIHENRIFLSVCFKYLREMEKHTMLRLITGN